MSANRFGGMPYLSKLASLSTITKCSSASSETMVLTACLAASRVWSPLRQNWEWAWRVCGEHTGNIREYIYSRGLSVTTTCYF